MTLDEALQRARTNRDHAISDFVEILRIPSISALEAHRPAVRRAAEWLAVRLAQMGMTVEITEGKGHPIVAAEWIGRPGLPTLGIYSHYDVQPPDPIEEWLTPPFEPSIRDGYVYGRGARDDKGQLIAGLKAAEYAFESGGLPLNLRFLYEGEEEITGTSLSNFLHANAHRLAADWFLLLDGQFAAPGVPAIVTALRGLLHVEIDVTGPAVDLHSGLYGGVAPNPLNSLARILAGLKDYEGRVTIPGFYEAVQPPSEAELSSWRALPIGAASLLGEIGAKALEGEAGYPPIERLWARPTFDVHGIVGGFMQEGTKSVIPSRAVAKASMRLVPKQEPERIFDALEQHVQTLTTPGVTVAVRSLGQAYPVVFDTSHEGVVAAQRSFTASFGTPAALTRLGATIPVAADFQKSLDADLIVAGFGLPDDRTHSPNERFSLAHFHGATEMMLHLMYELAQAPARGGVNRRRTFR